MELQRAAVERTGQQAAGGVNGDILRQPAAVALVAGLAAAAGVAAPCLLLCRALRPKLSQFTAIKLGMCDTEPTAPQHAPARSIRTPDETQAEKIGPWHPEVAEEGRLP